MLFMSSSWTELGDIFNNIHSVAKSLLRHLSSWLPGLLCLVEGEDRVEILWSVSSSKYIDHIVSSPSSQFTSPRRKPGGGESLPGSTRSNQDLCGVKSGRSSSCSPSDQQDRLSAITDKAGAGMVRSSLVQGGQVLHQARLTVFGHSVENQVSCTAVKSSSHYVVVPHLYTTGTDCFVWQCESFRAR